MEPKKGNKVVSYGSPLERKKWLKQGLDLVANENPWAPFIGTSSDSIIYNVNDLTAKPGQKIFFDFDNELSGAGTEGTEQLWGKEMTKMKFYDSMEVEFGRYGVKNPRKWDASVADAENLSDHTDSRTKLSHLWNVCRAQNITDNLQGMYKAPSHMLRPKNETNRSNMTAVTHGMTMDFLDDLMLAVKKSRGTYFTVGGTRYPLRPFKTDLGKAYYLVVMTDVQANQLRKDARFENIMRSADVRGNKNRLIEGSFGHIGNFELITMSDFFGKTDKLSHFKSKVEITGLRNIDEAGHFQGFSNFDDTLKLFSRGLILGRGALKTGHGIAPDFILQESADYKIENRSAMEVIWGYDKTVLKADDEDNVDAKLADMDWGVITYETCDIG